jgi:hypothetical protein
MPARLGYGQSVVPAGPLGVRQPRAGAFSAAVVLALLLHLPITPLSLLWPWLAALLNRDTSAWDYQDDRVIIPITLFDTPGEPQATAPATNQASAPGAPGGVVTGAIDAGVDADAAPSDASPSDARASDGPDAFGARLADRHQPDATRRVAALAPADAEALAAAPSDAGAGPSVQDPLSLVGGLRRAVEARPNVSLVLWFSTIRDHPLGSLVGSLLVCIPQWRDFIGDVVDPLQDLDGVMMVGPQLRDSSKITVFAQARIDDDRMQRVFAAVARRPGGKILPVPAGMRAVQFHADRADRVALTHPRNMIIVTPPDGFEQLRDLKGPLSLPAGKGHALSASLVTPSRPARALGLRLPESLRAVRIDVSAATDGGINVSVEFDDESPSAAEEHAPQITEQVRGVGGGFLFSDLEFVATGNRLLAETHVSRLTGAILLGYIRPMLCPLGFDGGRALPR